VAFDADEVVTGSLVVARTDGDAVVGGAVAGLVMTEVVGGVEVVDDVDGGGSSTTTVMGGRVVVDRVGVRLPTAPSPAAPRMPEFSAMPTAPARRVSEAPAAVVMALLLFTRSTYGRTDEGLVRVR
jgi:hypothetical protein